MKNLTISLDERVARWVRMQAAKQEMSMSRFVSEILQDKMEQAREYERAMKRSLAREPVPISSDGEYPGREELHDRPNLRRH